MEQSTEEVSAIDRLRGIVAKLRSPEGCPWDREQTHATLRAALLEECHEAIEAIQTGDDVNLREELGDLLLLVTMHAQIAAERGAFAMDDIADTVCEKLVRRHPHVFGEATATDTNAVLAQWDAIKRQERGPETSALGHLPKAHPALMRAQLATQRAATVGFDWEALGDVFSKVDEEIAEVRDAIARQNAADIEDELGDLLFATVNLARKLGVDSETALSAATAKFVSRFQAVEESVRADGLQFEEQSLDALNQRWAKVKSAEGR